MELSIVIPTSEILVNKDYAFIEGKGSPLSRDDSFWSLAVYEVWDSKYVYRDLKEMITSLWMDINCAQHYVDFKKETRDKFDKRRLKITAGVSILYLSGEEEKSYKLLPLLGMLLESNKKYNVMFEKIGVCDLFSEISNHLIQIQVDIQCSSKEKLQEFKDERDLIFIDIQKFEEIGITEEVRRLLRLMKGVDMEIEELADRE